MRLHAKVQCLRTTLSKPAVVSARHRVANVLEKAQLLGERSVVGREDERAYDNIRVAVILFREWMENDIHALYERGRVVGREEGVVDEDKRIWGCSAGEGKDARHVDEVEDGVCWRLDPDELETCISLRDPRPSMENGPVCLAGRLCGWCHRQLSRRTLSGGPGSLPLLASCSGRRRRRRVDTDCMRVGPQ